MTIPVFTLDFETTGLDPHQDRVLEVGLAGARSYASLVSDAPASSPAALAVHGIAPRLARQEGRPGRRVLEDLLELLGPGPVRIAAHNAAFERAFLEAWAAREGGTLPEIHWHCTLDEARELCPEASVGKSLESLAARFGWRSDRPHRAGTDAGLAWRLVRLLGAWRDIRDTLGAEPRMVYLAGPLRGDGAARSIRHNQERMAAMAQWAQGVLPDACLVVPHGNFAYLDESGGDGLRVRARILEACARLLARCDALVLCGEKPTPGMAHERDVAEALGLPVLAAPGWDPPGWAAFEIPAVA